MKKIVSFVLCLILLCTFAVAEEQSLGVSSSFNITFTTPTGYTYAQTNNDGVLMGILTPDQPEEKAGMMLVIAFSEEYAGKTMNDMSQSEIDNIIALGNQDFVAPVNSMDVTSHGTSLIITHETEPTDPFVDITTVYQGYFITLSVFPVEGNQITDEDVALGISILSDMEFTDL